MANLSTKKQIFEFKYSDENIQISYWPKYNHWKKIIYEKIDASVEWNKQSEWQY